MGNKVLESTKVLVDNPSFVKINDFKLEEMANHFANQKWSLPSYESPVYPGCVGDDLVDFFILINTINFAFKDFETKKKYGTEFDGQYYRGAMGMFASLKKSFDEGLPLFDGAYLSDMPRDDLKKVFTGNIPIPMFEERLDILRQVGSTLHELYDDSFHNILDASNNRLFDDGNGFIERLIGDFPSFDDSVNYDGQIIRFDKRAQLVSAMLYGRFKKYNMELFEDIDELNVMADYILPQTLRDMGILEYESSLAERIDREEIILASSLEEMELRASTIHVAHRMIEQVNYRMPDDKKINVIHMDNALWSFFRSGKAEELGLKKTPHHLTPTIYY